MKNLLNYKLYEAQNNILSIEELKNKYKNAIITIEEKQPNKFFVKAEIKTQGNKIEYLGALKGLVSKEEGLKFLNNIISKKYDEYY